MTDEFRDGMYGSVVVLFTICLVITMALAATNEITAPIIEAQRKNAVETVDFAGMPDSASFVKIVNEKLSELAPEAYMTKDKSYFVVRVQSKGFGGRVTFFVGMDAGGNFTGIKMGENQETPGIGSRIAGADYLAQYLGQNNPHAVDAVTGATITTRSLWAALTAAKEAYAVMTSLP